MGTDVFKNYHVGGKECILVLAAIGSCLPAHNCLRILFHPISYLLETNLERYLSAVIIEQLCTATKILYQKLKQSSCQKENKMWPLNNTAYFRNLCSGINLLGSFDIQWRKTCLFSLLYFYPKRLKIKV